MKALAVALALLGSSAVARAQGAGLAWVEPESGVTTMTAAGESLVARVRLPVALTPPPGVQQPRALEGWSGTLVGRAWSIDSGEAVTPSHAVVVSDVRPDAGTSLVYRARIEVPAWVAPGEYALLLATPGGVLGGARVEVSLHTIGSATAGPYAKDSSGAVQVRRADGALRAAVDSGESMPVRVALAASGTRPVAVQGAVVDWYPASSALDASGRGVVGVAWVAPGETLVARYAVERLHVPVLQLPTQAVSAGTRVSLSVRDAGSGARVAWEVGGRAVGWGDAPHAHVFACGGRERVRALVVAADGVSTPLSGTVAVRAAGHAGCAVNAVCSSGVGRSVLLGALLAAALLKTRRRRAFGNRVASDPG